MSDVSARLPRPSWVDLSARTELTVARRRVLELIETAGRPMTAADVASALDLHHNTVREHLDALLDAGFVEVSTKPTGRRGRPALRYTSTAPSPTEVLDSYLTLLDAISETLGTGPQARELALAIGRRWAQMTPSMQEGEDPQEDETASPAERAANLLPNLSIMGFAPEAHGETIILKACPLMTRARAPHPLVCIMHEGYLNEVYERGGPQHSPDSHDAPDSPADQAGGRTRLVLAPLLDNGCHVSVEN
ncbi:helix-turn-helix transcriptional regulator [Actinomyces massiliensis]|uniref:helix-turn-helix transcriptional regulator n=1 Tax=Actinomyces massiliensis TaxID=461393 RepID=UPI0002FDC0FC|nr:helix-turn-helix domain-containing protein [Actinomyces massiliensis]